ncbi:alpha-1,6-mannosyltransferase subunit [Magnaporthiopsis poae ATCC 64411]|uniref:Mannosyltransferase n=1 Tax=Magnaporthiopsis poae (strain ATCC 64411 / 73-15) TaxID=644358 RepID=A0A0C4DWH1_MAGP6|nr:alpha-1,6-mannosyltransferase subunit [Magnaporthiopsis poae ATCC 64411]
MRLLDALLSLLIPGLILVHLVVAPYTKVEESFNMQATHDVLVYGTPTSDVRSKLSGSYDHFTFPGAVPRTFVGPVILAGLTQPLIALAGGFRHAQLLVRAALGLFNAVAILVFKAALGDAYGSSVGRWYALLQASQFHVMFYASRTLPNMFAFGLTTLAFAYLLPSKQKPMAPRQRVSISLFVLAAVIFRSEVALLLAANALYLLVAPLAPLERFIWPFVISTITALVVSVPLDSYFWQRPLWPELWGFYYNAVLGSSSNWGVSPWHWYFTSALPRILLNPLAPFLAALALWQPGTHRAARLLVWPNLLFVTIYSLQPHKEARFIFYVAPPLTAAAALGAAFAGSGVSVTLALDKTEDRAALAKPAFWEVFDYLIVEDPAEARGGRWEVVGVVEGYAGVELLRPRDGDAAADDDDVEKAAAVVGRGRMVRDVKARVRRMTGGWWVGPRMAPRLHVLRRIKGSSQAMKTATS